MDPTEHEPVTFQIKIKRKKTVFETGGTVYCKWNDIKSEGKALQKKPGRFKALFGFYPPYSSDKKWVRTFENVMGVASSYL